MFSHYFSSTACKRSLWFSLLVLLLTVSWYISPFLSTYNALASGIMHVQLGDTVELASPDAGSYTYSWVLKQGEEVVPQQVISSQQGTTPQPAQTTANTTRFRHTFTEEGTYEVQLIRTDSRTGAIQNTTVTVLVSLNPPNFSDQRLQLTTLPPSQEETVFVSGSEAEVVFFASENNGGAREFSFDSNIEEDADGDGIPDNDRENEYHPSFFTGQAWTHLYTAEESGAVAQLTVSYATGETKTLIREIIFDETGAEERAEKKLTAVLHTYPPANQEGIIYLSGQEGNVTFFAGNSDGDIREYRIDKNAEFDTNGDGKADNDIDNRDHASFRIGSPWQTNFQKEWGDIVVELLVVGNDLTGSKLQRKIVFDDAKANGGTTPAAGQGKLVLSTNQIHVGENITFTLFDVPADTQISWDFDGDGVPDYEGDRLANTYQYQVAGEFPVTILLTKDDQEIARFEETIMVEDVVDGEIRTNPPVAEFSYSLQDGRLVLQNASEADAQLLNPSLVYSWDFGDGGTSDEESPEYRFAEAGTHTVVLTVTDAVGRSSTTAENIEVTLSAENGGGERPDSEEPDENEEPAEPNSSEDPDQENTEDPDTGAPSGESDEGMGWLWITVLILFIPFLLAGLYLVIRKIQLPDLSFEEIITEDLEKFREKIGQKRPAVSAAPSAATAEPEALEATVVEDVSVETSASEGEQVGSEEIPSDAPATPAQAAAEPAPLAQADAEAPDWLREATPAPSAENTAQPAEPEIMPAQQPPTAAASSDVPDWLTGVSEENTANEDFQTEASDMTSDTENTPTDSQVPAAETDADMPDWLKTHAEDADTFEYEDSESLENADQGSADLPPSNNSDLPDWLKGDTADADTSSPSALSEAAEENSTVAESDAMPEWLTVPEESPQAPDTPDTPQQQETDLAEEDSVDDDMPDWLKN